MEILFSEIIDELKKISIVSNSYKFYEYVKIETFSTLNYCNEFMVLYAKPVNDKILITDLNYILEDSFYSGIDNEAFKKMVGDYGLNFDGKCVFIETHLDNLEDSINKFIDFVKKLNL